MFLNRIFDNVKKAILLTFLIAGTSPVLAQTPEGVEPTGVRAGGNERAYYFPRWPTPQKISRERIPPPPSGPYMSSALSGSSIDGLTFEREKRRERKLERPSSSLAQFSPDTPWPSSNTGSSPGRWKPEQGYNYVAPENQKRQYNTPSNYSSGYQYPAMNRFGSGSNTIQSTRPAYRAPYLQNGW